MKGQKMKSSLAYYHSSYFYEKQRIAQEDRELLARAPSTDEELREKARGPGFGVVELTRTSRCFEKMLSRNDRVSYEATRHFLPSLATDFAVAMVRDVKKIANFARRKKYKDELQKKIAALRYVETLDRINARRRELAAERRKIKQRTTTSPMPTASDIRSAWEARKTSHEAMIYLGGLLDDLECYVDNCLKINEKGDIVGRNGGIRGWLKECLPELSPYYKTLMRFKAMAKKLRQATKTKDPTPVNSLLKQAYPCKMMRQIYALEKNTFTSLIGFIDDFARRDESRKVEAFLKREARKKRDARKWKIIKHKKMNS